MTTELPGKSVADELRKRSEQDASVTPMDAVLDAARRNELSDDQCFRLFARLWTLKRLMYYVYGGWAQGINLNEYPPAVAYLFGKQIYDESTHEMQFSDEILRRRWARTQKKLFAHPYAQFGTATMILWFAISCAVKKPKR
jgi:lysozyme family protein